MNLITVLSDCSTGSCQKNITEVVVVFGKDLTFILPVSRSITTETE